MDEDEVVHIPVEKILEVNRTYLLRKWWWSYVELLKGNIKLTGLNDITRELEEHGIIRGEGQDMPRDNAEDLAKEADEMRGYK